MAPYEQLDGLGGPTVRRRRGLPHGTSSSACSPARTQAGQRAMRRSSSPRCCAIVGVDDVACAFERAVAAFAEDADVRERACARTLEGRASGLDGAAAKAEREFDVVVASIDSLRKSVEAGEVDAESSAVIASSSREDEEGFGDGDFAAEMTLRYDDVADPARKGAFTRSMADAAAEFVLGLPEGVGRLYCACDGGVSRRAGVLSPSASKSRRRSDHPLTLQAHSSQACMPSCSQQDSLHWANRS